MEPLHDIKSAASLLRLSAWTLRKYIAEGRINVVRIGTRVLLEEQELRRIVAEGRSGGVNVTR